MRPSSWAWREAREMSEPWRTTGIRIASSGSESGSGSAASGLVLSRSVGRWCGVAKAGSVRRGLWPG